jgi:hypothetical protein
MSSRDRYRLGIIGAFVGLTFLLLPVRGDGSVEGLASQRTSPPVLTCSEAPAKSVGLVAYATGKTTDGAGARRGQELPVQAFSCGPQDPHCICANRYSTCMDACQREANKCDKVNYENVCNERFQACYGECMRKSAACEAGN